MKKSIIVCLIILALFLSGCGKVFVHHDLHRDGTSDITMEVLSESDAFLSLLSEGLTASLPGAVMVQNETGVKYVLDDVTPAHFNETTIFSGYGVSKEFKFPFYYYTYTWDLSDSGSDESQARQSAAMGIAFQYIVTPFGKITDTNGVYTSEDKKSVAFDMLYSKKYYVTFRQSFFGEWFTNVDEQEAQILGEPMGDVDME